MVHISELRRILQRLDGHLIFSLFLSTSGNFRMLSPDIKPDPSSRVVNEALLPFHPITESLKLTGSLISVGPYLVLTLTGCPRRTERAKSSFAKQKLLNGKEFLDKADISGSLACLATRFGLEFNEDEDSRDVSYKQVERHMRVCIAATTGFKNMITCSSSEPLLAEAAFHLMLNTESNPVKYLANHANLYCVDRGRRGELVAALIIMQARDASLPANLLQRRWVSVTDFMKALLPPQASEKFLRRYPTRWRKEEGKTDSTRRSTTAFLWKYVTRGAMIVCKDNQQGIDIILPMVWPNGNISRRTVSAIVIQVKNAKDFGFTVNNKLFDAMDPCGLGFLSDAPLPVIRMVFALASAKSGINFPAEREREIRHDDFTAYDIWCAGLSTESFQQIGHDLESYQKLLGRSQQSHDAFDVAEPQNPLSEETKIIKPNYDYFYDLFGKLILREGFQLDMLAFDWDVAGGKNQPGCTDKSVALQHERNHSPKRITRLRPQHGQIKDSPAGIKSRQ
ncbi:hypothetical protein BGY98DRAFT_1092902 [Russula aff. rugulosa BPL654]|nr:hypothetical protein BGY98DRAFT_1092902 [Russula aff. rugulosa BPL654]